MLPGSGSAKLNRWYFNQNTKQCLQFTYTGKRGNQNNFLSETDCIRKCPGTYSSVFFLHVLSSTDCFKNLQCFVILAERICHQIISFIAVHRVGMFAQRAIGVMLGQALIHPCVVLGVSAKFKLGYRCFIENRKPLIL